MAQAQEEANRTLQLARDKANDLIDKEASFQDAKRRADQIIEHAARKPKTSKPAPINMPRNSLQNLEHAMEQLLTQVRNGVQLLEEKHPGVEEPNSRL